MSYHIAADRARTAAAAAKNARSAAIVAHPATSSAGGAQPVPVAAQQSRHLRLVRDKSEFTSGGSAR